MNDPRTFRPQTFRKPPVKVVGHEAISARRGPNPDIKPGEIINRNIRRALVILVIMVGVVLASIKGLQTYWRNVDARLQAAPQPSPPPATLPTPAYEENEPENGEDETADITADPVNKALYLSRRAKLLEEEGRYEEAIQRYEDALAVNPGLSMVHGQIGRLYILTGRFDDAIASLTRALASHPDSPDLLNDLGTAYLQQGQADAALEAFHAALDLDPAFDPARFHAALASIELRQLDEARQHLAQYRDHQPEDARTFRELARVETLAKDYPLALDHLQAAIALDPAWAVPLLDAARILAATDRAEEALTYLDQALDQADLVTVFQIFQQDAFREARLSEPGRALQHRIAQMARERYLSDETNP